MADEPKVHVETVDNSGCDAGTWRLIQDANAAVNDADKEVWKASEHVAGAKAVLKAAEENRDARIRELRDLLDDSKRGQGRLDFGSGDDGDAEGKNSERDWRDTGLEELGLTTKVLSSLGEVGIIDLGGLADWTTTKQLTDIKGIKEATAEKIMDAAEKFWSKS